MKKFVKIMFGFLGIIAVPFSALGYWTHDDGNYMRALKIMWKDNWS